LIAVFVGFHVFLLLIWAAEKICLSYRNKRPGRKREKFTLLGELELISAEMEKKRIIGPRKF
jgi:hypothetical protein